MDGSDTPTAITRRNGTVPNRAIAMFGHRSSPAVCCWKETWNRNIGLAGFQCFVRGFHDGWIWTSVMPRYSPATQHRAGRQFGRKIEERREHHMASFLPAALLPLIARLSATAIYALGALAGALVVVLIIALKQKSRP